MRRRVHLDRLPRQRVVVQFDFRGARCESYWMVMDPGEVSVCLHAPGFDVDLVVTADLATLYRAFLAGRRSPRPYAWERWSWTAGANSRRAFGTGSPEPDGRRRPGCHIRSARNRRSRRINVSATVPGAPAFPPRTALKGPPLISQSDTL